MKWTIVLLMVVIAAGVAGIAYVLISGWLFDARIDGMRQQMTAAQRNGTPARPQLPAIVRAYALRAGGKEGGPKLFHARHKATLASARDATPMQVDADQWTGTVMPGIVWKAHAAMMGLPVTVVDAYVDGVGELSVRALCTFPITGGTGPDYDKGELMRYLSELPIYPDAILNVGGLTWRQLDPLTVEVSAQSSAGPAVMRFMFDAGGDIVRMEVDDRPMGVPGGSVPTPWHGLYSGYRQFGAYRVPAYGEVGWMLADGLFTYWKGTVVAYEPVQ